VLEPVLLTLAPVALLVTPLRALLGAAHTPAALLLGGAENHAERMRLAS